MMMTSLHEENFQTLVIIKSGMSYHIFLKEEIVSMVVDPPFIHITIKKKAWFISINTPYIGFIMS